jgi:hypothetical protein
VSGLRVGELDVSRHIVGREDHPVVPGEPDDGERAVLTHSFHAPAVVVADVGTGTGSCRGRKRPGVAPGGSVFRTLPS